MIREYRKEDAQFYMDVGFNFSMLEVKEEHRGLFDDLLSPTHAFTCVVNGVPIGSGGVVPLWENVYEGWVIGSKLINKHKVYFAKSVKKGLEDLIKKLDIIRLQTAIKENFPTGFRFAEWLGMENEGLMKKYDIYGNNCYRYARVK